jgi:hypothetical protein
LPHFVAEVVGQEVVLRGEHDGVEAGVPVATEPEVRFNKNRGGVGLLAGDECTG